MYLPFRTKWVASQCIFSRSEYIHLYILLIENKKINFFPDRVNIWRAELPSIKLYIMLAGELVYSLENDAILYTCDAVAIHTNAHTHTHTIKFIPKYMYIYEHTKPVIFIFCFYWNISSFRLSGNTQPVKHNVLKLSNLK